LCDSTFHLVRVCISLICPDLSGGSVECPRGFSTPVFSNPFKSASSDTDGKALSKSSQATQSSPLGVLYPIDAFLQHKIVLQNPIIRHESLLANPLGLGASPASAGFCATHKREMHCCDLCEYVQVISSKNLPADASKFKWYLKNLPTLMMPLMPTTIGFFESKWMTLRTLAMMATNKTCVPYLFSILDPDVIRLITRNFHLSLFLILGDI